MKDIFYCLHRREERCNCMKPSTGMIDEALNRYPNIDLDKSFYVGDSEVDYKLARKFNLSFYGINFKDYKERNSATCINDLHDFKKYI